jgi:hypothetical protein
MLSCTSYNTYLCSSFFQLAFVFYFSEVLYFLQILVLYFFCIFPYNNLRYVFFSVVEDSKLVLLCFSSCTSFVYTLVLPGPLLFFLNPPLYPLQNERYDMNFLMEFQECKLVVLTCIHADPSVIYIQFFLFYSSKLSLYLLVL